MRGLPGAGALLPALALGSALPLARRALSRRLLRNLRSTPASLGQPDGDRLLSTLDLFPRAAALQLAALVFVHRPFHLSFRRLSILGHASPFEVASGTSIFGSLRNLVYPRLATTEVGAIDMPLRTPTEAEVQCSGGALTATLWSVGRAARELRPGLLQKSQKSERAG